MAASLMYFQEPVASGNFADTELPDRYLRTGHVHFLMQACLNFIRRAGKLTVF